MIKRADVKRGEEKRWRRGDERREDGTADDQEEMSCRVDTMRGGRGGIRGGQKRDGEGGEEKKTKEQRGEGRKEEGQGSRTEK